MAQGLFIVNYLTKHYVLEMDKMVLFFLAQVKRDYVDGLGDTLDLVPIGAWHGNGRKAGW